MFTLIVENKYGKKLELTNNPAYAISSLDGFDPPDATINVTKNAGADGSVYNSAFANDRQITITMAINAPAEDNRLALYEYFAPKAPVILYYDIEPRRLFAKGYVSSMQINYFDKKEVVQIVVNCPDSWLKSYNSTVQDFYNVEPLFEFPFDIEEEGIPFSELLLNAERSIMNYGDVPTGALITIHITGAVSTPGVYNVDTGEYYILDMEFENGDTITINTRRGEKSVRLNRDGVTSVIIGYLRHGSTWFQFEPGDNIFTVAAVAGAEYMTVTFEIIDNYAGV